MSADGSTVGVDIRIKDVPDAPEVLFYAHRRVDRLRERAPAATRYVVRVARPKAHRGAIEVRVEVAAEAPLAFATASDPEPLLALRDAFDAVEHRLARPRSGVDIRAVAQDGDAEADDAEAG